MSSQFPPIQGHSLCIRTNVRHTTLSAVVSVARYPSVQRSSCARQARGRDSLTALRSDHLDNLLTDFDLVQFGVLN